MHHKIFHFLANTFLAIVLAALIIFPVSTVGFAKVGKVNNVLSAQDEQPVIQKSQKEIIMDNAKRLQESIPERTPVEITEEAAQDINIRPYNPDKEEEPEEVKGDTYSIRP